MSGSQENATSNRKAEVISKVNNLRSIVANSINEQGTKRVIENDANLITQLNYPEDHLLVDIYRKDLLKLVLLRSVVLKR